MAIHSMSSGSLILSLKVGLMSTLVVSMAVILGMYAPLMADFVVYDIPSFWNFMLSWLKPPYLYLVINCIIISIVASSKLQQKAGSLPSTEIVASPAPVKISGDVPQDYVAVYNGVAASGYTYSDANAAKVLDDQTEETGSVYGRKAAAARVLETEKKEMVMMMMTDGGDEVTVSKSVRGPERSDSMEFLALNEKEIGKAKEKPLVSARFSNRKAVKASPEGGKALRVTKPKRHDTLETTWKTITDGRAMPLTRHLKKSDTWDTHLQPSSPEEPDASQKMKKSETFSGTDRPAATKKNSTTLSRSSGSGKLRRDPSLGQDELNRRVEAFIKKFNEEMRLQRQESLNQYQEMLSRGVH